MNPVSEARVPAQAVTGPGLRRLLGKSRVALTRASPTGVAVTGRPGREEKVNLQELDG